MIRDYRPADAESVLRLNADNVPEVGPMDEAKLASFADWAPYFKVVDLDGEIVAMLIGLDQTAPYGSPNFGWFVMNVQHFAYIDRVAVASTERGQGWGPALYQDFERWAAEAGLPHLCAEVNIEPPNPRSIRFHEIYGFKALGEFEPTGSSDYRVIIFLKPIDEFWASDKAVDDAGKRVDWRSRVGTAGLVVGSVMMGLERALYPSIEKDRAEQVAEAPHEDLPRLDFGDADVDQLGPDEDGYWPE